MNDEKSIARTNVNAFEIEAQWSTDTLGTKQI